MTDHKDRRDRFCGELRDRGIACAIISCSHDVAYFTGHSSDGEDDPTFLILAPGHMPAVVTGVQLRSPYPDSEDFEVRRYENNAAQQPAESYLNLARGVADVLRLWRVGGQMVGTEIEHVPHFLIEFLNLKVSGLEFCDVTSNVREQRLVKTAPEIAALREAARVASLGQETARQLAREGKGAFEVSCGARARMQQEAGEHLTFGADLVPGFDGQGVESLRNSGIHRTPSAVLCNLACRVRGYWGDTAATVAIGETSEEFRKLHKAAREALEIGLEALRPGVLAAELDAVIRNHLGHAGYGCGPHTGHGVGVTHFEGPLIAPYNTQPIEKSMVVTLEPGAVIPTLGGVWLGAMACVTDGGAEMLSSHLLDL